MPVRADAQARAGGHEKRPALRAFFISPWEPPCQAAAAEEASDKALTLAARRLFWRAALFLWKMPLSATESITLWAALKTSAALAASPAITAFCTFLTAVRNFERSAVLAAFSFTS